MLSPVRPGAKLQTLFRPKSGFYVGEVDLHPSVLPGGQVIYSRWDYTGTMHIYLRPVMPEPLPRPKPRAVRVADDMIGRLHNATGGVVVLQEIPADTRFDDGAIATADVGSYRPNAWGLFDMHGNAAEWTLSSHAPYPYRNDGRHAPGEEGRKVVRGGSFYDRPKRCRSAFRLSYPAWQRVHNVGFRVVCR